MAGDVAQDAPEPSARTGRGLRFTPHPTASGGHLLPQGEKETIWPVHPVFSGPNALPRKASAEKAVPFVPGGLRHLIIVSFRLSATTWERESAQRDQGWECNAGGTVC